MNGNGIMNSPLKARDTYFQQVGDYFGYPECCIAEFIGFVNGAIERTSLQVETAREGFVPCKYHAHRINEGLDTLESIITNRKASKPFPIDDTEEDKKIIAGFKVDNAQPFVYNKQPFKL